MAHPPKNLQHVLWSVNTDRLDIETDKHYIIHQIFSHGRLEDFRWLFQTYSFTDIVRVFTHVPYKDYRPARFHFVKNILLGLTSSTLDKRRYVKNIPRALG
ncbi:hypothetical protein A2971_04480 [Candidatus Gottesmanbacteria bacterium RIFCSPLOWO2_01_FULL_46_21]|uniref:DUF6922 domain-containing protein n=1 Tax=Candidatus Gottesmanbacteria bacterium RIFCSPLOWO2_01_FULL_46_21 TaxID=1798393 RepID=A0A1F6AZX9_9BACT|nr:MAG: hypothetical protein A2971_04480 [Candidatus Gottesmanbacteria bacterium RIFCSPLOWO2_01_FULL_46_21]